MDAIIKGLLFVMSFYLALAVYGTIETYYNKKNWIPEFKELMDKGGIGFKIYFFLYSPISLTKRMF